MEKKQLRNVEIDECQQCKGIWFEEDELRKAKDSADSDLNWMDFEVFKHEDKFKAEPRTLVCPKCSDTLVSIDYDNTDVEIDCCAKCKGIWLEKGEFKKIVDTLTEELLTKSFSEYIKASLTEAKEILTGPESFLSEWKDFITVCRMMTLRLMVEKPKLLEKIDAIQRANPII
jgi:Zn-finger nucleic acid-binding protein